MFLALLLSATLQTPQGPPPPDTAQKAKQDAQHQADIRSDIEEGNRYAAETDKQYKASTDQKAIQRIQKIGAEMAAIANSGAVNVTYGDPQLSPFPYTFKVIQGDDVNAFSLPGGHIYVFEGLVKRAESDDELAGVLAHEVAHAALRHVATIEWEQAKVSNLTLPVILIAILAGGANGAAGTMNATQLVGQGLSSGWSVKAEEAADYAGFQYLQKSKYDPTGMLTFMERLASTNRAQESIDWGIYKTHPVSRERAETLTNYMKVAKLPLHRSKVTTTYRVMVKPADKGLVALSFGARTIVSLSGPDALTRADTLADQLNALLDSMPEIFEIRSGPGGQVLGKGKVLINLIHEDAEGANSTIEQLRDQTVANLKLAIFSLGYHVWER